MIPQTDPAWVPARVGKLTASRMAEALNFVKDGSRKNPDGSPAMRSGAERVNLLKDLLAERLVGAARDHFVSPAMQWGLDHEEAAVAAYEARTGNIAMPGGLLDHPTIENFAATPDRLIDHDGLLEVKCPTTRTFIGWCVDGAVPAEYKPQMLAQLACFGRAWCDFVAFDPRMPVEHRLFIRRFTPKREEIEAIERAAESFLEELDLMFMKFLAKE